MTCGESGVRLFSTWSEPTDPAAEKILALAGWVKPDPSTALSVCLPLPMAVD